MPVGGYLIWNITSESENSEGDLGRLKEIVEDLILAQKWRHLAGWPRDFSLLRFSARILSVNLAFGVRQRREDQRFFQQ